MNGNIALSERAAVIRRQLLLEIDLGFSFPGRNICVFVYLYLCNRIFIFVLLCVCIFIFVYL